MDGRKATTIALAAGRVAFGLALVGAPARIGSSWLERHTYTLDAMDARIDKAFHVSPFLGMDSEYRIRMTTPGEQLRVHMESRRDGRVHFDATLALTRRALSPWPVLRQPFMTARVVAGIYTQAARLRLKGAPYHPHPAR